jgi:hypothetical protein
MRFWLQPVVLNVVTVVPVVCVLVCVARSVGVVLGVCFVFSYAHVCHHHHHQ